MAASIWKGSISFGLLNIPVALQSAEEDKSIHFSMLDEKGFSRIRFQRINAKTGKEVPYDRIVKGYEYEPDQYVIMSKNDFDAANVKATQTIDIEDFVLLDEIDPMLFEKPYYLVPQKKAEKGYFLLRDALAETKKVAIGRIVIRTKQHLGMIMPRGDYLILELLRFSHSVRQINEARYLEDVNRNIKFSSRELQMAKDLIKGMTSRWKPEKYKDTYYDDVMELIEKKIKSGRIHTVEAPEKSAVKKLETASNVVDLMPLLKKSLEARRPKKTSTRRVVGGASKGR